jgi:hypothetical protein
LAITAPALVLAEIAADQQQIGPSPQLIQRLLESVAQVATGVEAPVAAVAVGEEMGITELE